MNDGRFNAHVTERSQNPKRDFSSVGNQHPLEAHATMSAESIYEQSGRFFRLFVFSLQATGGHNDEVSSMFLSVIFLPTNLGSSQAGCDGKKARKRQDAGFNFSFSGIFMDFGPKIDMHTHL
jgi:hypothetical protein